MIHDDVVRDAFKEIYPIYNVSSIDGTPRKRNSNNRADPLFMRSIIG